MAAHPQTASSPLASTALPVVLREKLRRQIKSVLGADFDRHIPTTLDDTFQPITGLTSVITRRREHLAKLHLKQAVIGIILDGRKEVHVAGEAWHLQPGDCFLLPAGIDLDVVNEPDERQGLYRAIVLNLPPALVLRAAAAYPDAIGHADPASIAASPILPLTPAALDSLVHAVREIVLRSSTTATILATQLVEHRVIEVMLHFADRVLTTPAALPRIGDRARLHLHGSPDRPWTAALLARELHMSEATLRRQLRAEGLGFKELLDDARLGLAKRLLPDRNLSIDSIALSCGYAARGKFEQRFKKLTGQTPQGFRQGLV